MHSFPFCSCPKHFFHSEQNQEISATNPSPASAVSSGNGRNPAALSVPPLLFQGFVDHPQHFHTVSWKVSAVPCWTEASPEGASLVVYWHLRSRLNHIINRLLEQLTEQTEGKEEWDFIKSKPWCFSKNIPDKTNFKET